MKNKTSKSSSPVKGGRGILYVCATPIGNLGDASFRLVETLKEADLIVAEDTRTVRKILSRYEIPRDSGSIISYQDHSGPGKIDSIIRSLLGGKSAALVSESGLPVIQDPGYKILVQCISEGIGITVIPGPNAALSGLLLSGLPADSFLFIGFLSKTISKRLDKLTELSFLPYTLIFYESPRRIKGLLDEILEKMGDRQACIAREITKLFEETIRGKISEIIGKIEDRELKGEIVLVVEGYHKKLISDFTEHDIEEELLKLLGNNIPKKNALKIIKSRYEIDRQKLYNIATRF